MKGKRRSTGQACGLFLILHILAVVYAVRFLHPYYASNDEFTLSAIASGAYGSNTHYFIYLHSAFGWFLKGFYLLFPGLNCYTLVMYGWIFLALTAIGFTWIRRARRTGLLLSVLLVLLSLWPLYTELQYTKTAAAVTAAGYVLLFCAGRTADPGSSGRAGDMGAPVWGKLPGIVFLLFGSWIRFQAFGMVSLVAFGLWLALGVQAWKGKDWKRFFLRDCAPCIVAFGLILGSITLENVLVYRPGTAEAHYREYDKARQQLLDYGVPEWEDYQEEYEALGLNRMDVLNLENWLIADSDRYTAETYRAIVAFRQERPFQWEYLLDYLIRLAKKPLFLLSALMAFVWLLPLPSLRERGADRWIAVLWPFAALLGIYLYFIKIYRVLPIVVTACLLSVVIFVWSAAGEWFEVRWERTLSGRRLAAAGMAGILAVTGLCTHMLITPALQEAPQEGEASRAFRKLYDTISQDKKLYYIIDPVSSSGMELGYSIFQKPSENYFTNIFTLGGWETESPQVTENLEAYGYRNLMQSLYQSDRSVLISDAMLEHLMLFLDDAYDGLFITYSKVNEIGDFDLYTVNYTMQKLTEDEEHTATLDWTETSEDGRYDVVRATVSMTPQELEGKSVFVWMESKESGKRRMYQGTWQQQDENGLFSLLYDSRLEDTTQVKFQIPKLSYRLDDRYEVRIVIRDGDRGTKLSTENHLYQ